jgi:putative flippase GtrA
MRQLLLYCLCGGVGVSTDYIVFFSVLTLGLWYQGANLLGYLAGTLISFFLNRIVTFNVRDKIAQRLTRFLGVAAVGFSVSALLLWLMVVFVSIEPKIAKLLTLPVVIILQFALNRKITFK